MYTWGRGALVEMGVTVAHSNPAQTLQGRELPPGQVAGDALWESRCSLQPVGLPRPHLPAMPGLAHLSQPPHSETPRWADRPRGITYATETGKRCKSGLCAQAGS